MRDLGADLKLCEAATPGPWEVTHRINDMAVLVLASFNGVSFRDDCFLIAPQAKTLKDLRLAETDTRFCAEARTGWPEAIRRAMVAEALVREVYHWLREKAFKYADEVELMLKLEKEIGGC